jgi:acyl-CoA reductase-like NAD-dependent aldehyde dehydrogenase
LEVLRTCKMYVGGKFIRSESGHYYQPVAGKQTLANMCLASRKDLRDAVVAARAGLGAWAGTTAFNRSQIMYRIAEVMEGRSAQFVAELQQMGMSEANARAEVEASVDRLVYFAGWCDKLQQVFSAVNPVSGTFFNFSVYEPTGVVVAVAPEDSPLLGLITTMCYAITAGNTVIMLASEQKPLSAISLSEVLHASDVPSGTVNILTGKLKDMLNHIGTHKDVNAVLFARNDAASLAEIQKLSISNLKRVLSVQFSNWHDSTTENPYRILDLLEVKTTWHPIENIGAKGGGY